MTVNVESFVPADSFNHNVVRFTTDLGYTTSLQYDEVLFRVPKWVSSIQYLVVAGGGGGGGFRGTGAGGGGMLEGTLEVIPNEQYVIRVGRGGYGCPDDPANSYQGGPSVFASIQATGGGFGCSNNYSAHVGGNGGSGGGGARGAAGGTGIAGQGYNGAVNGGGGGAGSAASGYNGGSGRSSSISGAAVIYAGGGSGYNGTSSRVPGGSGGGGCSGVLMDGSTSWKAGCNGTNGLGGGGGGAGEDGGGCDDGTAKGGNGGSGVVILRYSRGYMYVREYEVEYLGV